MAASVCRRRCAQRRAPVQSARTALRGSHAGAARAHSISLAAVPGGGGEVFFIVESAGDLAIARAPRGAQPVIGFGAPKRRFARLKQALFRGRRPGRLCFTIHNTVRLFKTGQEFFPALIERIDAAKLDVSLETYILCDDAAGHAISTALMNAARRGVHVRGITDGIGTEKLPLFDEWRQANVEHRVYNPHLFGQLGFSRTHRKLAVIDQHIAFCGGINIVDDFEQNGARPDHPRWDFAIEPQGPLAPDLREAFDLQWQRIALGVRPRGSRPPDQPDEPGASARTNRRALRTRLRVRRGL